MINNAIKRIYQEKNALLDEWLTTSGQQKLKILIRLMDIDDELAKIDKGGSSSVALQIAKRPENQGKLNSSNSP